MNTAWQLIIIAAYNVVLLFAVYMLGSPIILGALYSTQTFNPLRRGMLPMSYVVSCFGDP